MHTKTDASSASGLVASRHVRAAAAAVVAAVETEIMVVTVIEAATVVAAVILTVAAFALPVETVQLIGDALDLWRTIDRESENDLALGPKWSVVPVPPEDQGALTHLASVRVRVSIVTVALIDGG